MTDSTAPSTAESAGASAGRSSAPTGPLVERFLADLPFAVRKVDEDSRRGRDAGSDRPFLSVITRTTGGRATIVDTLTCLSAQTDDDIEVLLMVNTSDRDGIDAVLALVETFHEGFRQRIRVDVSTEPHRVHPLNRGIELARGRYITVLDDDDLVFADWVEQFRRVADSNPGAIVRCCAVDQDAEAVEGSPLGVTATAATGFHVAYRATFDLTRHLDGGQTPQGSVCFPLDVLDEYGLRFDPTMVVCEDLEFLLRAAVLCGVVDTGSFGLVYRRWTASQSSGHTIGPDVWEESMNEIIRRLDAEPILMPAGSASRLYQAAVQERRMFDLDQGTERLLHRVEVAERNWASGALDYAELQRAHRRLVDERDRALAPAPGTRRESGATGFARRVVRTLRQRLGGG